MIRSKFLVLIAFNILKVEGYRGVGGVWMAGGERGKWDSQGGGNREKGEKFCNIA